MSDLQKKISEKFELDREEEIEKHIDEMEGWFYFDNGIELGEKASSISNRWKYLTYLIAASVGDLGEKRDSEYVNHQEANDYFDWSRDDGNTARNYAHYISGLLEKGEDTGRRVKTSKISEAIEEIRSNIENE